MQIKTVIADAGYGSEENYDYLEEKGIVGIVKYGTYEKEKKKSFKKKHLMQKIENMIQN